MVTYTYFLTCNKAGFSTKSTVVSSIGIGPTYRYTYNNTKHNINADETLHSIMQYAFCYKNQI